MAYKEWREKGKSASGVSSIKLNYGWQTCNSESDFVFGHPQNSLTYLEKPIYGFWKLYWTDPKAALENCLFVRKPNSHHTRTRTHTHKLEYMHPHTHPHAQTHTHILSEKMFNLSRFLQTFGDRRKWKNVALKLFSIASKNWKTAKKFQNSFEPTVFDSVFSSLCFQG